MICFLTSRTDLKDTGEVNPANGFVEELLRRVANPCRAHLFSDGEREELRGEVYRIRDGKMTKIASNGDIVAL